jgi:hypothetical protein
MNKRIAPYPVSREMIENRRKFLRGITDPDDWVDALCDAALLSLSERRDIPDWEGRYKLLRRFLSTGVDYAPSLLMQANDEADFDRACDALLASEESANG